MTGGGGPRLSTPARPRRRRRSEVLAAMGVRDPDKYRAQGDLSMYTDEKLEARLRLRRHPDVVEQLERFHGMYVAEEGGRVGFQDYVQVYQAVERALDPDFSIHQSRVRAFTEWTRDRSFSTMQERLLESASASCPPSPRGGAGEEGAAAEAEEEEEAGAWATGRGAGAGEGPASARGAPGGWMAPPSAAQRRKTAAATGGPAAELSSTMTREQCMDSAFELADQWTKTTEVVDYVTFLSSVVSAVQPRLSRARRRRSSTSSASSQKRAESPPTPRAKKPAKKERPMRPRSASLAVQAAMNLRRMSSPISNSGTTFGAPPPLPGAGRRRSRRRSSSARGRRRSGARQRSRSVCTGGTPGSREAEHAEAAAAAAAALWARRESGESRSSAASVSSASSSSAVAMTASAAAPGVPGSGLATRRRSGLRVSARHDRTHSRGGSVELVMTVGLVDVSGSEPDESPPPSGERDHHLLSRQRSRAATSGHAARAGGALERLPSAEQAAALVQALRDSRALSVDDASPAALERLPSASQAAELTRILLESRALSVDSTAGAGTPRLVRRPSAAEVAAVAHALEAAEEVAAAASGSGGGGGDGGGGDGGDGDGDGGGEAPSVARLPSVAQAAALARALMLEFGAPAGGAGEDAGNPDEEGDGDEAEADPAARVASRVYDAAVREAIASVTGAHDDDDDGAVSVVSSQGSGAPAPALGAEDFAAAAFLGDAGGNRRRLRGLAAGEADGEEGEAAAASALRLASTSQRRRRTAAAAVDWAEVRGGLLGKAAAGAAGATPRAAAEAPSEGAPSESASTTPSTPTSSASRRSRRMTREQALDVGIALTLVLGPESDGGAGDSPVASPRRGEPSPAASSGPAPGARDAGRAEEEEDGTEDVDEDEDEAHSPVAGEEGRAARGKSAPAARAGRPPSARRKRRRATGPGKRRPLSPLGRQPRGEKRDEFALYGDALLPSRPGTAVRGGGGGEAGRGEPPSLGADDAGAPFQSRPLSAAAAVARADLERPHPGPSVLAARREPSIRVEVSRPRPAACRPLRAGRRQFFRRPASSAAPEATPQAQARPTTAATTARPCRAGRTIELGGVITANIASAPLLPGVRPLSGSRNPSSSRAAAVAAHARPARTCVAFGRGKTSAAVFVPQRREQAPPPPSPVVATAVPVAAAEGRPRRASKAAAAGAREWRWAPAPGAGAAPHTASAPELPSIRTRRLAPTRKIALNGSFGGLVGRKAAWAASKREQAGGGRKSPPPPAASRTYFASPP